MKQLTENFKRVVSIILICAVVLSITACAGSQAVSDEHNEEALQIDEMDNQAAVPEVVVLMSSAKNWY